MNYMTGETIFIDSSVFLAFFIEGVDLFEKLRGDFTTSTNVIEEVVYVLIKEKAGEIVGVEKHYDLLKYLRDNPEVVMEVGKEVISDVSDFLDFWKIRILPPAMHLDMFEIIAEYGLLPNDALIVATCKYYGIKKIATFDEDFKRVDFLEIIKA